MASRGTLQPDNLQCLRVGEMHYKTNNEAVTLQLYSTLNLIRLNKISLDLKIKTVIFPISVFNIC